MRYEEIGLARAQSFDIPAYASSQVDLDGSGRGRRRWWRWCCHYYDSSHCQQKLAVVVVVVMVGPCLVESVAESCIGCYGSRVEAWEPIVGGLVRGYRVRNVSEIGPHYGASPRYGYGVRVESAFERGERVVDRGRICATVIIADNTNECRRDSDWNDSQAGLGCVCNRVGCAAFVGLQLSREVVGGCGAKTQRG